MHVFNQNFLPYCFTSPKIIYNFFQAILKSGGNLGCDGMSGASYGEGTPLSIDSILDYARGLLDNHTAAKFSFVDIGSGWGKVIAHCAAKYADNVKYCIGLEFHRQRVAMAYAGQKRIIQTCSGMKIAPFFTAYVDVEMMKNVYDLADIWYVFNSAFEKKLNEHIASLFNSSNASVLIIFTGPHKILNYGYEKLVFCGQIKIRMVGPGEGKTARFYKRKVFPSAIANSAPLRLSDNVPDRLVADAISLCISSNIGAMTDYMDRFMDDEISTATFAPNAEGQIVRKSHRISGKCTGIYASSM